MKHALKRLELNGFKSFAAKTILEFPAGITAIVGPNGSGKSNIIDAVRWLLGEREAKNLRGGKSEDLIFAGTPKRPRLGIAQAALFFENAELKDEAGRFGDASEIAVMREAHRDGSNYYYLNGSEVRLKDIIDFFAQARLGSKGLSVITQGNSDLFIRVSPAERRMMIEEILGLREFQIKKTDAERRLKNSGVNLEKVNALIAEIQPHLRSLKRQTARWSKRTELESELRGLEDRFFGVRLREVDAEFHKVEQAIRDHKDEQARLLKAKTEAERRLGTLEASRPEEREELKSVKDELQKLNVIKSQLEKDTARLEARLEMAAEHAAVPASASELHALVNRIKSSLQGHLSNNPGDWGASIREILREIEVVLGKDKKGAQLPDEFRAELSKINAELKHVEIQIQNLKRSESALEKNDESYYEVFKRAMSEMRATEDELRDWEKHARERELNRERLLMRKEELTHQIVQIGRKPQDFVHGGGSLNQAEAEDIEKKMLRLRGELMSMGEVDEVIMKEALETEERHAYLTRELADLIKAEADLRKLISGLNQKIKGEFEKAFEDINAEFQKFFELMFGGGTAKMKLVKREKKIKAAEEGELTPMPGEEAQEESGDGVEVQLSLPRKKINSLDALSGGERSLVGIAAVFAMVSVSPPPFLVLDEIDAPLDERNARRFAEMLKEFSKKTQFIVVTHNRATMEAANVLYGITLNDDGTSKVISMKLE